MGNCGTGTYPTVLGTNKYLIFGSCFSAIPSLTCPLEQVSRGCATSVSFLGWSMVTAVAGKEEGRSMLTVKVCWVPP